MICAEFERMEEGYRVDAEWQGYGNANLRRLIMAVQQGTRYDETLLPEEAEQELKKLESEE